MHLKNNNRFFVTVIVAVLCGLAAGVLGEIVTRVYFLKDFSFPYLSSEINLSDLNNNRSNLIIRDAKKVVVSQDLKVGETLNSLSPSLVGVFKALDSSPSAKAAAPEYYKLDEPELLGLIITADGWVVAPLPEALRADFRAQDYVAIMSDRKLYQIDKVEVLPETDDDLALFHLVAATNLPVKKIITRPELSAGLSLLALNSLKEVRPLNLAALSESESVLSSDVVKTNLILSGDYRDLKNAFVFDFAGNLVAFVSFDQKIIPAFASSPIWQNILSQKRPGRPFLGVNYLDLSLNKVSGVAADKGALLYPTDKQAAVLKNSPAQIAGLRAGDVITWVGNQEINGNNDLSDVISNYNPGDQITLTYQRAGLEKELSIKLGELK